jgi:hypothetical protein
MAGDAAWGPFTKPSGFRIPRKTVTGSSVQGTSCTFIGSSSWEDTAISLERKDGNPFLAEGKPVVRGNRGKNFGGLAIRIRGPMALRPTLTDSLPLSVLKELHFLGKILKETGLRVKRNFIEIVHEMLDISSFSK